MKKLKFQIISDFHFELRDQRVDFELDPLLPSAPVLIVPGDTGNLLKHNRFKKQEEMKYQLDYLSENWKQVYMIPGNHEYYWNDLNKFPDQWFEVLEGYENIYMGNRYYIELGQNILIFATLWTEIPEAHSFYYKSYNDFKEIFCYDKPLILSIYNNYYREDLEFIRDTCKKFPEHKKIIITHHLPDHGLISRMYRDSNTNDAYASRAFAELGYDIDTWIFGHSHQTIDKEINGCRFISNAWGFSGENFDKSDNQVIELEI